MSDIRRDALRRLRNGSLTGTSPLSDVKGIGPYLQARIGRAVRRQAPTIAMLWRHTDPLSTARLTSWLLRTLQNERGNQCLRSSSRGAGVPTYHAGAVNHKGYEAVVALLDFRRQGTGVAYGALPARMPVRATAAKECGCRSRAQCTGACEFVQGGCVPRFARNGFVGVDGQPGQAVSARTDVERRRVRSRSRVRDSGRLRRDPDSLADWNAGHRKSFSYVPKGGTLWIQPSPRVRLPN